MELRLCIAKVLGQVSVTNVIIDNQGNLDDVPFGLWSVVVKLLCDDDPLVRDQMASSLSMLVTRIQTSKTAIMFPVELGCAVVPPMSLESAMRCVWCLFIHKSPVTCVSWMIKCVLGDLTMEPFDQEDETSQLDRLFEKGPLNVYTEDCIVARIACQTIRKGVEMENGTAVLKNHSTDLLQLLQCHLKECIVFLESVLSKNWSSDSFFFGLFYRALSGLNVIVMLIHQLDGNTSSMHSQIGALLSTMKNSTAPKGLFSHSMIKDSVAELSKSIAM